MPLSTTWVWHVNAGGVKGVLTKFLIWSSEREAVKGFSVIVAVRQLNESGYVLALKLIFGTLNLRIFESLTADNSGVEIPEKWEAKKTKEEAERGDRESATD